MFTSLGNYIQSLTCSLSPSGKGSGQRFFLTPQLSWGADSANVFVVCVRMYTLQPLSARTISSLGVASLQIEMESLGTATHCIRNRCRNPAELTPT